MGKVQISGVCDGTDGVRKKVREVIRAGAQVIKAFESGRRVPSYAVEKSKRVMDAHHESIARAYRAGISIARGTDSGVGAPGTNLEDHPNRHAPYESDCSEQQDRS